MKLKPINDFYRGKDPNKITQYIGIAADEPKRLERLKTGLPRKVSLLEKYGYTEEMAFELCEKYGLLSPIYDFAPRGGGAGSAQMQDILNLNTCEPFTGTCGIVFWRWKKSRT